MSSLVRRYWKPILLLVVIGAALGACGAPISDGAAGTAGWLRGAGAMGLLVVAVAYVAAGVAGLPVGAVTTAAGFAYGVVRGFALLLPVALIGALASFWIGRTLLRARLARRMAADHRFAAIDRAIGDDGFRVTVLMRLAPVLPFGLTNYALSATSVRPTDYAVGSVVGQVPSTLALLYLGAGAEHGNAAAIWWIGLGVTAVGAVVFTRIARRALRQP